MKYSLIFFFIGIKVFSQDIATINNKLIASFKNVNFEAASIDSVPKWNTEFSKLMLKYTVNNSETISYDFKDLITMGMKILTSEDSNFRIYSWKNTDDIDEDNGNLFFTLFQYKHAEKTYALLENSGSNYFYLEQLTVNNKTIYFTQKNVIDKNNRYNFIIKPYSINKESLNENINSIKTESGLQNELSFLVDFTNQLNQEKKLEDFIILIDNTNKSFSIPIVTDDLILSNTRIQYKFDGHYFVKVNK